MTDDGTPALANMQRTQSEPAPLQPSHWDLDNWQPGENYSESHALPDQVASMQPTGERGCIELYTPRRRYPFTL